MRKERWERRAACAPDERSVDLDWFSTDATEKYQARAVCESMCPVRKECLQFALDNKLVYGIWGGVDDYELRRALSVDSKGDPVERSRAPRCPYCVSKNLTIATVKTSRGYKTVCNECELSWYIATSPKSRAAAAGRTKTDTGSSRKSA